MALNLPPNKAYKSKPQDNIKEYLDTFVYPLYFFDYETLMSIVPHFDGMKPYK
jgi:hypothetical protein